jgi:uncharacterized protein YceH (UPF0502 family)
MRGPGATRPAGPDGARTHEVGRLVDRLVEICRLRDVAEAAGDSVEYERLLARQAQLDGRLDDLVRPGWRGHVRDVKGGPMAARKTTTEATVEVSRPLEDELAAVEQELAALPALIEAATADGDEVALARWLVRKPIVEARVAHLRGRRDSGYLEMLDQHLADAQARHAEVLAAEAAIISELQGRLAAAAVKVAEAWTVVLEARWAVDEEQNRKPAWWWTEQGLAAPGSTPVADRVKTRVIPDRRMASFYAERGDQRFGPSPVDYGETTKEQNIPFGGPYPGAVGSEMRDAE